MQTEINKLTPEYFFNAVSEKTGVEVDEIRKFYNIYLSRIQECLRKDRKVTMRGLGIFELSPNKMLHVLYHFIQYVEKNPEIFIDTISTKDQRWYNNMSRIYKELLLLKKKYDDLDFKINKLRTLHPRFSTFFDEEGNQLKQFTLEQNIQDNENNN